MDQHPPLPDDKGPEARDDSHFSDYNMEFLFMVAGVAALILVVIIQASCIIIMSGSKKKFKKNSISSLYHHPHAQPQHGPPPVHLAPPYHHNYGLESEENGKTDWVPGIRKTSYEKNELNVSSSKPRKLSSQRPQGSGASAFKAESKLRRRSTAARILTSIIEVEDKPNDGLVCYADAKFNASLKGIIDIQGRLTEPFSLVIVMEGRNMSYDQDYTKYTNYLALNVDRDKAWFSVKKGGVLDNLSDLTQVVETETGMGLEPEVITTYWLSYDRDNMIIKYGKGYAMEETTLMSCDFSEGVTDAKKIAQKREKWSMFFSIYEPDRKEVTLLLYRSSLDIKKKLSKAVAPGNKAGFIHIEPLIEVRKEPLVVNPSPFVMDATKVTMNLIDKSQYTFSSELPGPCRILYDTIKNIELDIEFELGIMEMRLSDAIRHSMTTEGCLLHKTLKSKSYLRITIGPSARQSPGIPYVLEFWPPGARSPVHNHGSVCAILKVVFGTIQNGTYNKMPSTVYDTKTAETFQPKELFQFDCNMGDVLWMSPEWYQTHQLRNVSDDFCATINCYRYDEDDPIQWNLFDYVNDANGQMGNFFPNTDFSFGEMRRIVLHEWSVRHRNKTMPVQEKFTWIPDHENSRMSKEPEDKTIQSFNFIFQPLTFDIIVIVSLSSLHIHILYARTRQYKTKYFRLRLSYCVFFLLSKVRDRELIKRPLRET